MKRLLLIDVSGLFWSSWHASADEEISSAFDRTVAKVTKLREGFDLVAVCCDSPPYFRKEIHPEYKAQRDAPPPQAVEQFDRVKKRLHADGLLLWHARGYEADDLIAAAVDRAKADGLDVTIASSDKDLMQLVDDDAGVRVVSTMSGATYTKDQVIAKFGVPPDLVGDLLALMGDTSDNVPGVPGVGVKTAAKLLLEFGSFREVFENVDKVQQPKLQAALYENAEQARVARKLVTLRTDAPIEWKQLYEERKPTPLAPPADYDDPDMPDAELDSAPAPAAEPPPPPAPTSAIQATPQNYEAAQKPAALATVSVEWELEPRTLGAAYKLAKGLANSRLYSRLPNAEAIWAIIIRGREMGMGALTALDNFHLVEGKPCPHAHLLIARAKAHPDCEYFQFLGGDDTYAEYETKNRRNPKPTRLKFTIEQAKKAGLVKDGSNWTKRPGEMLRKTAGVQLGRIEYPEATQGLYAIEEMGGEAA
jgi:5'-3' exonuclease